MITIYDYIVIGVYFLFLVAVGFVFRRFNKNTSDYFRAGGAMVWWIAGASAFMTSFSAWSFTGAAAKIYETGLLVPVMFLMSPLVLIVVYFFTCYRFRRLRVVTTVQAIRNRFGDGNEQFYAWTQTLLAILFGGFNIYVLAIFVGTVLSLPVDMTIWAIGLVILIISFLGGAWAIAASNFVQLLIIALIAVASCALILRLPAIGGFSGLIARSPHSHFHWEDLARGPVIWLWLGANLVNSFYSLNSLDAAGRFLFVKNEANARKATLMWMAGALLLTVVITIPPLAASIAIPNIQARYATLNTPTEAAYLAMCMQVLPQGLIGLLVCGIFAATLGSADAGVNKTAGILVKNVYLRLIRPRASEKEEFLVGKVMTVVMGTVVTLIAHNFAHIKGLRVFEFTLTIVGTIALPLTVPLVLGLFIRRTPDWACWGSVLAGAAAGSIANKSLDPSWFAAMYHWGAPLNAREILDVRISTSILASCSLSSLVFVASTLLYKDSPRLAERLNAFHARLQTPIDLAADGIKQNDREQFLTLGWLCVAFGGLLLLGALIPNEITGRVTFLLISGTILAVGLFLLGAGNRMKDEALIDLTALQPALGPCVAEDMTA